MTPITPAFIILLIILCVSICVIQKQRMIIPIVIAICFMPADISFKIATLDFSTLRVLVFTGFLRLIFSSEKGQITLNKIDYLFIIYQVLGSIIYILASDPKINATIFKAGNLFDSLLLYYILRHIIKDENDIELFVKTCSFSILFLLPFAAYEYYSATNLFSILGRSSISMRDGEVRVACTFSHAILFGSFAAAVTPLLITANELRKKILGKIAILSCFFYTFVCGSSGPLIAMAAGLFYTFFFRWKKYGRHLYWLTLSIAFFIHFAGNGSLWGFIYTRLSFGSSTGYHRFLIVDSAIKEFSEWWLLGYGNHAPQWHSKYWPWAHATFTDITNQYILVGVRGGLITMILFIILCYQAVKSTGRCAITQTTIEKQRLYWGITVTILVHCISFLSVSYFGQITMLFYLSIALAALSLEKTKQTERV